MQISSPFSTLYLLSFDEAKRTESEGKYYFDSDEKKERNPRDNKQMAATAKTFQFNFRSRELSAELTKIE